ncbi:MAG: ABC transporter substrate-binding protein [Gammaproteobacteria bacterium]|jgi:PAS domain S-box-containing protein|nr:ABC transporter substrate-binding protein [Gammaproteobacteria bacterium]MBT7024378.1 ABC transporter substrate-binding protein [Gammaproteobacteria bacterium]
MFDRLTEKISETAITGLLFLLLFSLQASATEGADNSQQKLEPVRLQLKWLHQFQFAGYYAAIEQGYYRDAGFEVTLLEHPKKRSPMDVLLSGDAEYVVMGSDLLVKRSEGKPLVALAAIAQHDPLALLVTKASGITHPKELRGKRVMLNYTADSAAILSMLKKAGLEEADYSALPTSYNVMDLVEGKTDAYNAYVSNEGFLLNEQGVENTYLHPLRYGIDFYSDILTTTEHEIEQNPQRVARFREASLKGWAYAMANSDPMVELILQKYNTQNRSRAHLKYEAEQMREMVQPLLVQLGYMHRERWVHIRDIFQELGFLKNSLDIDGLFYQPEGDEGKIWRPLLLPILVSIAILGGIILLVVFWNRKLQQQVARRTAELEQVTEHIELILQSMNEGLIVTDANRHILRVNRKLEQLTGIAASELLNQGLNRLLKDGCENGEVDAQCTLKTVGEELVPVQISGAQLQHQDGEMAGTVLVVHDLRDRVRAEHQEQYAAFQAGVADMGASVLHNIGNVITGMSGNVIKLSHTLKLMHKLSTSLGAYLDGQGQNSQEMSLEQQLEHQRRILQGTVSTLQKLGGQIEESGSVEKLENGIRHVGDIISIQQSASRHVIHATKFTLSRMLNDTSNLIEDRIGKYNACLKLDLDPAIKTVQLPRNPLMQLLLNLIKNSLEAVMEEMLVDSALSGTIRITVKPADAENFWITVEDNGCGLDADKLKTIFYSGFTTKQRGSGYGLHSAARFVESLGGSITAHSPGLHQGMVMQIKLPLSITEKQTDSE